MGSKYCMPKNILYVIFILQLISTAERQIFDFRGYMWLPILANFFHIIFVIFGVFGLYQFFNVPYLVIYNVWNIIWIGYNVFIVCYYLSVGDLSAEDDLLSFGTGAYSWWLVNTPGCKPHYNSTLPSGFNPDHPVRPDYVVGCYMRYEDVEVTHAGIQLVLSVIGMILTSYMIHFAVKILGPKREKQGLKAMYSIEYSPHHRGQDTSNPNTLERETDLHEMEAGEARAHMTPRRVKRRSYRNSGRSHKSLSRQNRERSSSGHKSARSSARSHKSINPVTRLIDADQNRADSSTSNDYGQINPGFQSESRPNSIYNLSLNPPTDVEASRPQSTLTSYSNFHHQRRLPASSNPPVNQHPGGGRGNNPPPSGVTTLTQESLMNHESGMNCSYDDLPPPPPPLSSSPSPPHDHDHSDTNSSVVTAQMPVPQLRSSIRRNEYVNIPVQPKDPSPENAIISHQSPEPQSPVPPRTSSLPKQPQPVSSGNYVNYPGGQQSAQPQYNGARPRTNNPLYKPQQPQPESTNNNSNKTYLNDYTEVERSQARPESIVPDYETRLSYEAETLRADTKLTMPPPYYNDPYSDNASSQRSSQAEPIYPPAPPQRGYLPVPAHARDSDSSDPRYFPDTSSHATNSTNQSLSPHNGYHHQPESAGPAKPRSSYPPPSSSSNETDSSLQQHKSLAGDYNNHASVSQDQRSAGPVSLPLQPSETAMRRIPSGGRSRDRASLRQRQRREMEAKASKQSSSKLSNGHNDYHGYVNASQTRQEDAFSGAGQQKLNNGKANGYADMSGGGPKNGDNDDKWYMKDSMRPVGAASHGQACKCYRCQRKLTAI